MQTLDQLSDALYGFPFAQLSGFQQKNVTTFWAGQVATEALAAIRGIICPLCDHKLGEHIDRFGIRVCTRERGDRQVQEVGAVAQGPCGCTCEDLPDLQQCIEVLRKAAA